MEESSKKSSSELPLKRKKENLKITMNKKVAASARPIKLNGSLCCSKHVHYCLLWQRVKRGNFHRCFDETTNKNNILTELIPLKKIKLHFAGSNRNPLNMKNIDGVCGAIQ